MNMREQCAREVRKVLRQSGKHMLTYAIVDAVLAALREPTPEMVVAGFHANIVVLPSEPRSTRTYHPPADNIPRVWAVMLAAAIPAPKDGRP